MIGSSECLGESTIVYTVCQTEYIKKSRLRDTFVKNKAFRSLLSIPTESHRNWSHGNFLYAFAEPFVNEKYRLWFLKTIVIWSLCIYLINTKYEYAESLWNSKTWNSKKEKHA